VELNVEEQCINVIKTAVLQKSFVRTGTPTVHGWVFDMRTGTLIDLKLDFEQKLKDIREIYDLGAG
jgi:carbonic anhydrase